MFSAVLDDVSVLRDSIATIAELLDETELRVTEQGIELIAADRAVVVVLDFFLSKHVFSEYHFEQEERIGMNLVNFFQVLRRANASDQVHIQLDGKKLNVTFATKTDSVTPLIRSFVLPLIDISKEETPPLGQLRFPAKITMNADLLASGIDDAELIADSVILTVRKDKFVLRSESDTSSTQL
ncbi:MAG: hypothetical protein HY832_03915, partial [Candidatus Aenigmarchaeota archaeon]|nr:hypothetical protein [Candidatus Aenigmarchaeota archaeon]